MMPKEKSSRNIWYMLQIIELELSKQNEGSSIINYTIRLHPQSRDTTLPDSTEEQRCIRTLEKWSVIEGVDEGVDEQLSKNVAEVFPDENFKKPTIIEEFRNEEEYDAWRRKKGNPSFVGIPLHLKVNIPLFNKKYAEYEEENRKPNSWKFLVLEKAKSLPSKQKKLLQVLSDFGPVEFDKLIEASEIKTRGSDSKSEIDKKLNSLKLLVRSTNKNLETRPIKGLFDYPVILEIKGLYGKPFKGYKLNSIKLT